MSKPKFSNAILKKARTITGKRSRIVVDHILEHGSITTEDLENYGYKHPPRAIRDVREQGLPLEMFWTKNSTGRKIAGYRFGNVGEIRHDRLEGRRTLSKEFHEQVCDGHKSRCAICLTSYQSRYLQLDHRVPYEVDGEPEHPKPGEYMPLCGSCNRAKSWSCEHCTNWIEKKDPAICSTCYWASPENYEHMAGRHMRRLDVVWEGVEVDDFKAAADAARAANEAMPTFVKRVLRRAFDREER
ncbi:MAG TPA: hypothetical protein PKH24_08720 [Sedimentisphaerales bacterium]|jgi:hypothetical protein|nr:hypothetical protein [Sedimentisphaerales bacterium]HNU28848.1 hypothetical protein [Sedimentisphaerales bacterium]